MKKGLLIEDNEVIRKVFIAVLEKIYEVDIAETGGKAIKKIIEKKYDFILLDLGLPDIQGKCVIKAILNSYKNKLTPILIQTAQLGEDSKPEYYRLGVDEVLIKGFKFDELYEKIDHCLSVKDIVRETRRKCA